MPDTHQLTRLERFLWQSGTLAVYVVPGMAALRAIGLRLPESLRPVASPYQAQVLLIVGVLPAESSTVIAEILGQLATPYAIMTVQAENNDGTSKPLIASLATTQEQFEADVARFRAIWPGEHVPIVPKTTHSHHATAGAPISQEQVGHDMSAMTGMAHDMTDKAGGMSMLAMTEGAPRSADGLAMESALVSFGPFHSGLPTGMQVLFNLDGDTVQSATLKSGPLIMRYDSPAGDMVDALDQLNKLIQFLELCGGSGLARRARSVYWRVWGHDQTSVSIEQSARRLALAVKKSRLLRLRLRDLAVMNVNRQDRDAWARVLSCVDEIVYLCSFPRASIRLVEPLKSTDIWAARSKLRLIETALIGREVGDALVALASFDVDSHGSSSW